MSKRWWNIIVGVTALFFGGGLYVFLRSGSYVAGLFDGVDWVVRLRLVLKPYAYGPVSYLLPDYLWGLSLSCSLVTICEPDAKGLFFCVALAFACGCIWEMVQFLGVVQGTCDILDVLMYFLASLSCVLLNLRRDYNEKN